MHPNMGNVLGPGAFLDDGKVFRHSGKHHSKVMAWTEKEMIDEGLT